MKNNIKDFIKTNLNEKNIKKIFSGTFSSDHTNIYITLLNSKKKKSII